MPGTNLSFPYDSEIFNYQWKTTPDLILTSMLESGAVVRDGDIANMISNGSNFFTVPYYNLLTGTPEVYNGVNDFVLSGLTGGSYSGIVYGRQKAWSVISFIKDFNSGADPMAQIVSGVANYWIKQRQTRLIALLTALFAIVDDGAHNNTAQFYIDWLKHSTDITLTADIAVADANLIGETSIQTACVKACGDNAQDFSLVIMHSVIANRLANLQLLNYSKYTDAAGITRDLPIGTINGKTVIINDSVPCVDEASSSDATVMAYTTYILGLGAIRFAEAPVDIPSEMDRDPKTTGGVDLIYTRIRECLHPYGFTYIGSATADVGIPDGTLNAAASWDINIDPKSIFMARIITNG